MDQLNELNMGHLVLNPHPNDLNTFEDQITIVVDYIKSKKTIDFFSINVEYGKLNKLSNKHLDIILFSKSKIDTNLLNSKGKDQPNLKGQQKEWIFKINPDQKPGNTIMNKYWNYKNVKKESYKFMIGYNHKENYKPFIGYNIAQQLPEGISVDDCVTFYNDTKEPDVEENNYMDIIPLNNNNITNLMLNFIRDEEIKNIDRDLQIKSMRKGYCWLNISPQKVKKLLHQLKVMREEESQYDIDKIKEDQVYKTSDPEEQLDHLLSLRSKSKRYKYLTLYDNGILTDNEIQKLTGMSYQELNEIEAPPYM